MRAWDGKGGTAIWGAAESRFMEKIPKLSK